MAQVLDTDARGLGAWHIPRSRGALSGVLLMALGVWGALIPFIGPYFDFGFTQDGAWTWSSARFWLELLPGIATFAGGLLLLISANRGTAALGAWLAIAAGAWFVLGPTLAGPWHLGTLGAPRGGSARQALEWISFFYGLGVAIVFLGSTAWGRLSVRGVRDVEVARRRRALRAGDVAPRPMPPAVAEPQVYPSDRPATPAPGGVAAGDDRGDAPPEWSGERASGFGRHRRRSHR
ncbi:conserved membrane hypothetical protein [Frankia canadensis]|uniref:Secreted protein n=1 Tax=Frankia canadensis TaxID=1836972 RepID=A0A2I2KQZ1_9ACTN|nr:hypothetical protein [Frankia canadensis]SNQ48083.1 conserved membrane hypothetical protein [Frankia canadensis]SOU55373.1 conserved membrane hypothetical protein [Frankia canadensis]